MTYLDSNVLVYAALNKDEIGVLSRELLKSASVQGVKLKTSVAAIGELMHVIHRNRGRVFASQVASSAFSISALEIIPLTQELISEAVMIFASHSLKTWDCVHLATMRHENDPEIISEDQDFDSIPGIKRISISEFAKRLRKKR